ncbi:unnamed protein product, partial [Hapterophycus canaliculatus]
MSGPVLYVRRWITVRDRTRTPCPYVTSTVPQKAGEEAHENGIGMPPPPLAGAKLDEKEFHSGRGGKPASGRGAKGSGGAAAAMNDSQNKSRPGGGRNSADAAAGSLPEVSPAGDANAADESGGDGVGAEGRGEQAEGGGGEETRGGSGVDGGDDGMGSGDGEGEEGVEKNAHPYSVKPRGAPTSAFLQEAARRAAEAKEAAKVDPWQSDGEEEEERDAAAEEEEDCLRGERVHAWVLVRGGKRGAMGVSYVEPTTGAVYPTSEAPYLTVEGLFNAKNYWVNMQQQQQQQQKQQLKESDAARIGDHSGFSGRGSPAALSFDLLDGGLWEYVFIDPMQEMLEAAEMLDENDDLGLLAGAGGTGGPGADDDAETKAEGGGGGPANAESKKDSILDIPPSWVRQLTLDRDLMALRYPPSGQRTVMYRRTKAELFAENVHSEGTTMRLTLFKVR